MLGNNADVFPEVLRIYVPDGSIIADVTYGRGVFWRNVDCSRYKLFPTDLMTGTDARQLPYADSSIDCVVLDPPYMHSGGSIKHSLDKGYRNNQRDGGWRGVLPLYRDCAKEALRVLRVGGILIVKCQDTVVNHKQSWLHVDILNLPGYLAEDLFVVVQRSVPLMTGHWKKQYHARKNHSYFVVLRKAAGNLLASRS
jgi:hypothetical protein